MEYFRISCSRHAGTTPYATQRGTYMATATTTPGKSDFIREVLGKNPQATFKAVNEAWTKAGNEGSISQTLVNKMRSEAGLSGNLRTRAKPVAPTVAKAEKLA